MATGICNLLLLEADIVPPTLTILNVGDSEDRPCGVVPYFVLHLSAASSAPCVFELTYLGTYVGNGEKDIELGEFYSYVRTAARITIT